MDRQEPVLFELLVADYAPTEVAARLLVASSEVNTMTLPAPGTPYSQFPLGVKENAAIYGDLIYTYPAQAGDGYLAFHFARQRSYEETKVPVFIDTDSKPCAWDPVLQELIFVEDSSFPMTVNTGTEVQQSPRVYSKMKHVPGWVGECAVEIKHYLSPVPFPLKRLKKRKPVPSAVAWNFLGSSGNHSGLHPDVTIPDLHMNGTVVYGAGTEGSSDLGNRTDEEFPSTGMTTWRRYVMSIQSIKEFGQHHLIETSVIPPRMPRAISS